MLAKACKDCAETFPLDAFAPKSGVKNKARGTRDNVCSPCRKARRKVQYARTGRDAQILRNFNLTAEQYARILADQDGRCAVCRADHPRGGHGWSVDHDHSCCPVKGRSCGKCVRGLLCLPCNTVLGAMNDDVDLLMAAAAYLLTRQDILSGVSRMDPIAG